MANQYTITHEGSSFQFAELELERQGYYMEFACTYGPGTNIPEDLDLTGRESGWEMRRLIKAWCEKHGVENYKIIRNRGYRQDLHGNVYELWLKSNVEDRINEALLIAESNKQEYHGVRNERN